MAPLANQWGSYTLSLENHIVPSGACAELQRTALWHCLASLPLGTSVPPRSSASVCPSLSFLL